MQEVLCLHLNARWAIKFITGEKPISCELPPGYREGTQFEFRSWQPTDRWSFYGPLPYRQIVLTASDFFLGIDGPEDPNARAIGVFDIVAIEQPQEGEHRFHAKHGFDATVKYVWICENVRPFPTEVLRDPTLQVGATRGFYKSHVPGLLMEGLPQWQSWEVGAIDRHRKELVKVLY